MAKIQLTEEQRAQVDKIMNSDDRNLKLQVAGRLLLVGMRGDVLMFARKMLPDYMMNSVRNADGSIGKEMCESPEFHSEIIELFQKHRNVCIAAPRGHSKSTLTGLFYVLHEALYERKSNIVLVSASEDLAIKFLRDIRTELEFNQRLIWIFGYQKTEKWSEKEIHLKNGCKIYARGRGGQIRGLKEGGNRPDLIIIDDLEDDELVRSEQRRLDLESWFNGDVLPSIEPIVGEVKFIGTILHEDSLLNRVLSDELYPDFVSRKYQAISEEGEPLWPGRFSLEYLNSIKASYISRGQLPQFYMEYMNDPMPIEGAIFTRNNFKFIDVAEEIKGYTRNELFIDLGGGSLKKTADDTAMVVVKTDLESGVMYLDHYIARKYGTDNDAIIKDIFKLVTEHKIGKVYIEKTVASNMLQAALDRAQKERGKSLNIEYIVPPRGSSDRRGNMSDAKYQRIAALADPMKFGKILIRKWMTELMEQLERFPRAKHDDIADALSYAYMFGKRRKKKIKKQYIPHRGGTGYLRR
jgi:predicted phage terminase large subunit-like protein